MFSIAKCEFKNNSAVNGGALAIEFSSDSLSVVIEHSLFDNNSASLKGGAIYYTRSDESLQSTSSILIKKNTFLQNTAQIGSVLFSGVD